MKTIPATLDSLDGLRDVDSACLLIVEDERPIKGASGLFDWRLCGEVSRALQSGFFAGATSERLLIPSQGRVPVERVFVMGLGPAAGVSLVAFEHSVRMARDVLAKAGAKSVAFALPKVKPDFNDLLGVVDRVFHGEPVKCQAFANTTGRVV